MTRRASARPRQTAAPAHPARAAPRAGAPVSPAAEALEERIALAVYTVTNTTDTTGPGSLRRAILDANAFQDHDTIVFDAGVFSTPRTIQFTSPPNPPQISQPLTILGPGPNLLTVRRDTAGRVFDSFAPTLNLSGMTVTGTNGGGLGVFGVSPNATLDDMVFTGNIAPTNSGGGIFLNNNATLTIRNSTLTNNRAVVGGGIFFFQNGSLLMENCTVSNNTATGFEDDSNSAGGVYFSGTARPTPPPGFTPNTLVVRNSTLSGNSALRAGGGLVVDNLTGTLLVQNSTISGNTSGSSGGGIMGSGGTGTITLQNSTVTLNTASTAAGAGGGGIARLSSMNNALNLVNSVVSRNTHDVAPDVRTDAFTTVAANSSAVGSAAGFTLTAGSSGNLPYGANPLLAPLAANGGPTLTHALLPGSPLVNAGSNARVPPELTTDQRGPGFPRVAGPSVDIGAYEAAVPPAITKVFISNPVWAGSFNGYLQSQGLGEAAFGYAIPAGPNQLQTLPWLRMERVAVRFDRNVTMGIGDLVVAGVNTPNYPVIDYTYDAATFTAVWYLGQPLRNDKVLLKVNGGVTPFRINPLPGDVDRSGTVLATDYVQVKKRFFKNPASPVTGTDTDYSAFHDIDGTGQILATDYAEVKKRFFNSLPAPEPQAAPPAAAPLALLGADDERPADALLA